MKLNNPLVSIIIPAYNRADLIGETLDSMLAQTYQNWECIVVDDGSTDNTKEVVRRYVDKDPRFILVDRPENHKPGGNGARNYGFEISKGKYVLWFDSDDLMLPSYLNEHISILNKSGANFSICDLRMYFPETGENKKWLSNSWIQDTPDDFVRNYIMFRYGIGIISIVWKKSVFENRALFDESLQRAQEYEFFCRLFIPMNLKKVVVNKILVYYRQTPNNFISQLKAGDETKIKSALDAKLSVLNTLKEHGRLTDDLKDYFITDALSYLQFNLDVVRGKVADIVMSCGYVKTDAQRIVLQSHKIIKQTKNRVNTNNLSAFVRKQPTYFTVQWYITKFKLAKIKNSIQQNLR